MLAQLDTIQTEALAAIAGITDEASLEEVRIAFLGKRAASPLPLRGCATCPPIRKRMSDRS